MDPAAAHASPGGSVALFVLLVALPALSLCFYLWSAHGQGRAAWPARRSASFAAGALLIAAAVSPPFAGWAHHDLRGHMVQHLMLGMFAPLALALGAPGTLLLRTVPTAAARGIVAALAARPVRLLIHPFTAALLDIGGMYVLYLTPLYAFSLANPLAHVLLHVHFVMSGYLFSWSIAGPDPAPHRARMPVRLATLFLATAAHAVLAKLMFGYGYPRGTMAGIGEIRAAAQLMYYGGDLAELLLIVAFFAIGFGRGRRSRRRAPPAVAPAGGCGPVAYR